MRLDKVRGAEVKNEKFEVVLSSAAGNRSHRDMFSGDYDTNSPDNLKLTHEEQIDLKLK